MTRTVEVGREDEIDLGDQRRRIPRSQLRPEGDALGEGLPDRGWSH